MSDKYGNLIHDESCGVDNVYNFPVEELHMASRTPSRIPWVRREVETLLERLKASRYDLVINRQFTWFAMCLVGCLDAKEVLGPYITPARNPSSWTEDVWLSLQGQLPSEEAILNVDPMTAGQIWNLLNNRTAFRRNVVDLGLDLARVPGTGHIPFAFESRYRESAGEIYRQAGLDGPGPLLGVQAGASVSFRRLPSEMLVQTLDHWLLRHGGKVAFWGIKEERERVDRIIKHLKQPEAAANLAGSTDLLELAACLERLDLLLSPDTGTLHLAAAVNIPTVSLYFGSAYPWETGPYGKGHFICYSDTPCYPCRNTGRCRSNGYCRTLFPSLGLTGLLETALDLSRTDVEAAKEDLIRDWTQKWSAYFGSCGVGVLHTGWQEQPGPLVPECLTPDYSCSAS